MRTLNILLASMAIAFGLLPAALHGQSASSYSGVPDGAVILDEEAIPAWAHQDRRLLFWVLPSCRSWATADGPEPSPTQLWPMASATDTPRLPQIERPAWLL